MCGRLLDISMAGRMVCSFLNKLLRPSSESVVSMNIVASASVFLVGARRSETVTK